MDFDIIGVLLVFWIIFTGVQSSKKSKKAKEERAKRAGSKTTKTVSTSSKKQKPQPTKTLNPFEKLMKTLEEMEEAINKPEPPPKAKPIKKVVTPMEERSLREKQVSLEKKAYEEKLSKEADSKKGKIGDVIEKGEQEWKRRSRGLEVNKENVINGIIWSEILQAPRAQNKFKNKLMK